MLEDRWKQLEQNIKLKDKVNKTRLPLQKTGKTVCVLDFNGVLCEKDVTPKINQLYYKKIHLMFDPLLSKNDQEVKALLEKHGLQVQTTTTKPLGILLRDFVAETCSNPAKGTAARKTVYDLAEPAFEAKEISVTLYPDVFPFLQRTKEKRTLILLSRGSQSLLSKMATGIGLNKFLTNMDSTIEYGNAKVAETFIQYFLHLATNKQRVTAFLEDEWDSIQELVLANVWLSQKFSSPTPLFTVIWVDRDNELKDNLNSFEQLNRWIQSKGFVGKQTVHRVTTLEQVAPAP